MRGVGELTIRRYVGTRLAHASSTFLLPTPHRKAKIERKTKCTETWTLRNLANRNYIQKQAYNGLALPMDSIPQKPDTPLLYLHKRTFSFSHLDIRERDCLPQINNTRQPSWAWNKQNFFHKNFNAFITSQNPNHVTQRYRVPNKRQPDSSWLVIHPFYKHREQNEIAVLDNGQWLGSSQGIRAW